MTFYIGVYGYYSQTYKESVSRYAEDILNEIVPYHLHKYPVEISVTFVDAIYGLVRAQTYGDRDEIEIEIALECVDENGIRIKQNRKDMLVAVAHELVHVKQVLEGRLWNQRHLGAIPVDLENEAYDLEENLYEKFWIPLNYLKH